MRVVPTVLFALVTASALGLAGTGQAAAAPKPDGFHIVSANGTFGASSPDAAAVTYNPALVSAGSRANVFSLSAPALGTSTVLAVHGLVRATRWARTPTQTPAVRPAMSLGRTSSTPPTR